MLIWLSLSEVQALDGRSSNSVCSLSQQFFQSSLRKTVGASQNCCCTLRVVHKTPKALSSTFLRCPWIPLGSIVSLQVRAASCFLSAPMAVLLVRCILIGLQLFQMLFSFFLWIDGAFSVCLQILKHAESPVSFICYHPHCIISHRCRRRVCLCVDAELVNDAAVVEDFSPLSFGIGS